MAHDNGPALSDPTPSLHPNAPALSPRKMMIVEDDPGVMSVIVTYFSRQGYDLKSYVNGTEAILALARGETFDIVLSDLRLPGASGLEVLSAAKKNPSDPTVILITAYASIDTAIEAMNRGAYTYVRKPIMDLHNDLGQVIERAMHERELERENALLLEKLKKANILLARRQQRIDRELEMAGHIQRSLLPDELVHFPGITIASRRIIGEVVSGDFYDAIALEDGSVGILMGQALGRDIPSALLMASISGHFRELARQYTDPSKLMAAANNAIRVVLEKGYENFVTAFYGIIDAERRTLTYASAAHPTAMRARFSKSAEPLPRVEGTFLGKYPDSTFETQSIRLFRDDRLFLFSENVPEICNEHDIPIGTERLGEWITDLGVGRTFVTSQKIALMVEHWDPAMLKSQNVLLMLIDML